MKQQAEKNNMPRAMHSGSCMNLLERKFRCYEPAEVHLCPSINIPGAETSKTLKCLNIEPATSSKEESSAPSELQARILRHSSRASFEHFTWIFRFMMFRV